MSSDKRSNFKKDGKKKSKSQLSDKEKKPEKKGRKKQTNNEEETTTSNPIDEVDENTLNDEKEEKKKKRRHGSSKKTTKNNTSESGDEDGPPLDNKSRELLKKKKGSRSENRNRDDEDDRKKRGSRSESRTNKDDGKGKKKKGGSDEREKVAAEFEQVVREEGKLTEDQLQNFLKTLGAGPMREHIQKYRNRALEEEPAVVEPEVQITSKTKDKNGLKKSQMEPPKSLDNNDPAYLTAELENPYRALIKKIKNEIHSTKTFLESFLENKGFPALVQAIAKVEKIRSKTEEDIALLKESLALVMVILKQQVGRDALVSDQQLLNELALISYSSVPEAKKPFMIFWLSFVLQIRVIILKFYKL